MYGGGTGKMWPALNQWLQSRVASHAMYLQPIQSWVLFV